MHVYAQGYSTFISGRWGSTGHLPGSSTHSGVLLIQTVLSWNNRLIISVRSLFQIRYLTMCTSSLTVLFCKTQFRDTTCYLNPCGTDVDYTDIRVFFQHRYFSEIKFFNSESVLVTSICGSQIDSKLVEIEFYRPEFKGSSLLMPYPEKKLFSIT